MINFDKIESKPQDISHLVKGTLAHQKEPDGTYTVSVTATAANGNSIVATTSTVGVVSSVDTSSGTSTLSIGNVSVPLNAVTRVS